MIVRWGLERYDELLGELVVARPLLVTTGRWLDLGLARGPVFDGVRPHVPRESVEAAVRAADGCDGLVAVGGGSAIDTAKAVSAATGLPVLSVPTTYSGAEWTRGYGVRDEARREKGGGGGANVAAILYDSELTLTLPREQIGGTALNALAHASEALYVEGRNAEAARDALAGARLISVALPRVLETPAERAARRNLLEGAMHAGAALAGAGLGLGHALAQALGGRFGIAHGAANALCLPVALRFNETVARAELEQLADAMGVADAADRAEELARLAGFRRLRVLGVPEGELRAVAEAAVRRAGARANPRRASPDEALELLRTIW